MILERIMSTDAAMPREFAQAILATGISTHNAISLYHPSLVSLLLGVCQALFLAKGILSFKLESNYELVEVKRSLLVSYTFPQSNVLVRVRTIALWLAAMLAISTFHLEYQDSAAIWWRRVTAVMGLECAIWSIIGFLVNAL
jgi:hypothetical protein